jgi:hypothetical protein
MNNRDDTNNAASHSPPSMSSCGTTCSSINLVIAYPVPVPIAKRFPLPKSTVLKAVYVPVPEWMVRVNLNAGLISQTKGESTPVEPNSDVLTRKGFSKRLSVQRRKLIL